MSEQSDYYKYLIGDHHVDGWKSAWRLEQEKRRKNQVFRSAIVVKARPVPKVKVEAKLKAKTSKPTGYKKNGAAITREERNQIERDKRVLALQKGLCGECHYNPARRGRTNCESCQKKRTQRDLSYRLRKVA